MSLNRVKLEYVASNRFDLPGKLWLSIRRTAVFMGVFSAMALFISYGVIGRPHYLGEAIIICMAMLVNIAIHVWQYYLIVSCMFLLFHGVCSHLSCLPACLPVCDVA
jgi:hypothetical protein